MTLGGLTMRPMGDRAAKDALFDGFAGIAKALASGRRAEIVDVLAQGERSVDDIADEIGQSVANTSHHLRAMARAGLLTTRRDGPESSIDFRVNGWPSCGRRCVTWPSIMWPASSVWRAPTWVIATALRLSTARSSQCA